MINNKLKVSVVLGIGIASFICYCIALSACGTGYTEVKAAPFMEIRDNGYHIYYDLAAVSKSYTIGVTSYSQTTKLSDFCNDDRNDDYAHTCNQCQDVSNETIGLISAGFFTCICAIAINIIQFFNASYVLIGFAAVFMFFTWVFALGAFANYQANCYQEVYDKSYVSGLSHGNGFNATVTAFVLMFINFIINFIPGKKEENDSELNAHLINNAAPAPPPV